MQDNTSTVHVSLDLVKTFIFPEGSYFLLLALKDPEIRLKEGGGGGGGGAAAHAFEAFECSRHKYEERYWLIAGSMRTCFYSAICLHLNS